MNIDSINQWSTHDFPNFIIIDVKKSLLKGDSDLFSHFDKDFK